ncbi:hypothetical protein LCGC14_1273030 [marine sediment metagenome]|uniref:ABC3 transporter permease C-terminal domain-containing protein n=1 Tax=marine sediment metagenome TaxID=412755 RepID=A0A0F9P0I4_9ZZZZ
MGIITKIALRNMKRRKFQYIFITITLILSVSLFGGVMIASDSISVMMLYIVNSQIGSIDAIADVVNMIEIVFLIFGLISLILSMILIKNIFNIIRKEQEYETGIFQAIGISKFEIFKLFLIQGIIMGVVGAIIGTIFSYFVSYVIFTITMDTLHNISFAGGFILSDFEIILLPFTIITTFIVGLFSCIIVSSYPSWKASRKSIIECLHPIEEKTKIGKKYYIKRVALYIISSLIIRLVIIPNFGINIDVFLDSTFMLLSVILILSLLLKYITRGFSLLFLPYLKKTRLLTEKNMSRNPKRTILTFSMIALTTGFFIGMNVMTNSLQKGIDTTVYNFTGSDIRIYSFIPRTFEDDINIQSIVEDVMVVGHQNARIQIEGRWIGHSFFESEFNTSIFTNVINPEDVKEYISNFPVISPDSLTSSEIMNILNIMGGIIIEETLANDYNINVGDILPMKFSRFTFANLSAMFAMNYYNLQESTIIVNMSVVGVVGVIAGFSTMDFMGLFGSEKIYNVFVSWTTYDKVIDVKGHFLSFKTFVYDWFVWIEDGMNDEKVLNEVSNFIEDKNHFILFSFTKLYISSNLKTIFNMITFIMNGLLLFTIIITMIGLVLHSLLNTISRKREIGMLRSIGLSKKGVISSISGETIILVVVGIIVGVVVGVIQGILIVNNFPGRFLVFIQTIPWLTIIILISVILFITIISSRYIAKWSVNLNIIDIIRTR